MVRAIIIRDSDRMNSQIEQAFNRGKIRSDEPNIMGSRTLPNPPISIGIMKKKIMNKPWKDITDVYCWDDAMMYPMIIISQRNNTDDSAFTDSFMAPAGIYKDPIITWLQL